MNDREQSHEDELEQLFQALNSPLSGERFVSDVMRRTNRYGRRRRLTLGISATVGIAISAASIIQLVDGLVERLMLTGVHWSESAHLMEFQVLVAVILCSVTLPAVLRWMSR